MISASKPQNRLKNITYAVSLTIIANSLITIPIIAQEYPPLYLFQPYASKNYPYRNKNSNLIQTIEGNNNLQNLKHELEQANLSNTLTEEEYTVFAPTDKAFNALSDEDFAKFSQPENRIKVLKYHLVAGKVTPEDLEKGEITTVEGNTISVESSNQGVLLNGIKAKHPPTATKNGVIIEIDEVLLPPDF